MRILLLLAFWVGCAFIGLNVANLGSAICDALLLGLVYVAVDHWVCK